MNGPPPVIVLDGEQRSALAVVRSLGRHGYPVHVGSALANSLGGGSRFAVTETRLPDPLAQPGDFTASVAELIQRTSARVLLPLTDASILAVLEERSRLGRVVIPSGDLEHFRRAADKENVLALARDLGMAVPAQWTVASPAAPPPAIPANGFPVVLKPARSVSGATTQRIKVGVSYAASPDALGVALARLDPLAFPVLLQQRIAGPGLGVFLLRWNGKTFASFAHRRLREFPPSGGVSVTCESTALPPDLLTRAESLLEKLDWSGVAMVEFKKDGATGPAFLMEVNPRFWGSLQLAIDAGVDFPWYLVRLALGEPVDPVHSWRRGIRSRWEWGEVNYLLARVRKSRAALDLPADAPGMLRVLGEAAMVWRPRQRGAVFRLRDPRPFFRESVQWFRALRGST
jgi:predicted ATP-grasp superfamily ATP-dependent carboligase